MKFLEIRFISLFLYEMKQIWEIGLLRHDILDMSDFLPIVDQVGFEIFRFNIQRMNIVSDFLHLASYFPIHSLQHHLLNAFG